LTNVASLLDPAVHCPDCGIGFLEFRRLGRLGCPRDYDVFRDQLRTMIERLHRHCQHTGKKPALFGGPVSGFSDQRRLRRELAIAVANDDLALAARLRDELREKDRTHGP
jgi:protein arginine kinase activator